MPSRRNSQGFLVGEPIDLGSAAEELSAIRKDTSAIRKSLDELLTRAPGTNADRADGTPQMAVRKADFANTRDEAAAIGFCDDELYCELNRHFLARRIVMEHHPLPDALLPLQRWAGNQSSQLSP